MGSQAETLHLQAGSLLTPALFQQPGECLGSVSAGLAVQARMRFPLSGFSQCPPGRPVGPGVGPRLLSGSRRPRRPVAAWVPRGKVNGSRPGPPSPRPRRPGFLPLTPGAAARGCWASSDKGQAAWPRLIRSRADPGGNRRAGISERAPPGPAPGRRGQHSAVTPHRPAFRFPRHRTTPAPAYSLGEGPGCIPRGNRGTETSAFGVVWICPLALNTPCPNGVSLLMGWRRALSGPLGPRDPGAPFSPPNPPGWFLFFFFNRSPPNFSTPMTGWGTPGYTVLVAWL